MTAGRTVLAVPGPVRCPASAGMQPAAGRRAGRPARRRRVLVALGWSPRAGLAPQLSAERRPLSLATPIARRLGRQPATLDQLLMRTGLSSRVAGSGHRSSSTGGWRPRAAGSKGGQVQRLTGIFCDGAWWHIPTTQRWTRPAMLEPMAMRPVVTQRFELSLAGVAASPGRLRARRPPSPSGPSDSGHRAERGRPAAASLSPTPPPAPGRGHVARGGRVAPLLRLGLGASVS